MFKSLLSYFWKDTACEKAPLTLDEAYNILNECEDTSIKNEIEAVEDTIEDIADYEVCSKIGKITEINDETYTIDGVYTFKSDSETFLIGTKVSYTLLRSPGEIKVGEVQIVENDWNVVDTNTVRKWYERTLVCTVSKREGRLITVTPGDIIINLNEVPSAFIPIVGDWLEIDVKCEVDETVVDLSGKVLEIQRIAPLRHQLKLGKITQWNCLSNTGTVDNNIFFNSDSLYCGYLPVKGDRVVVAIIESNQGRCCTWRALKIVPDNQINKRNNEIVSPDGEDYKEYPDIVTITNNVTLTFTKLGESKLFNIQIDSLAEDIELVCVEIPKLNGQCRLSDNIDRHTIKAKQSLTVTCACKAKCAGESREAIIFHFKNFKIRRWVTIRVADSSPEKPARVRENKVTNNVPRTRRDIRIRGQKLGETARFASFTIPDFPVPERLQTLVTKHWRQDPSLLKNELERMKPCLVTPLSLRNFEDRFHTLLHLDEIHAILEMRNYDQERACFIKSGEYLLLEVENLVERRPSIVVSDRVIAMDLLNPQSAEYEGYIHKITKNHLHIKFDPRFHNSYNGEDYAIYIIANRATYKRAHYAVNQAVRFLESEWLFPTRVKEKEPQVEFVYDSYYDSLTNNEIDTEAFENKPSHNIFGRRRLLEKINEIQENGNEILPFRKLEWFNRGLNYYQKEAVRNVLLGVCRPLPYIIFGPPGTGKTVTLVETILQILRHMPHSRLLVAAPSNSAADLIALRLIDSGVVKPGDLVRLVAFTAISGIPARLAPYCATANIEREGTETSLPTVMANGLTMGYTSSVLGRHRITVSTCSSAGILHQMGFSRGHFSHIIVDEAGQTSEPSVLIPLSFLDISSGQAILAGDPMQLGPVVLSSLAADYGLEESFLERMVNRFPYMRDSEGFPKTFGFDPRLITKLIYNYRSLPDLLKLPSSLFYNDDLIATISTTDSKEASILEKVKEILPQTKEGTVSPILFHGVNGENSQAEDSPSWLNPQEASQVFFYVNELYRLGLKESDIGIITPYKAQVKQLLDLFKEAEFNIPKIGTVEEFQGQEFNVILLSTVRSSKRFVPTDIKYTMGFISSPRRLNVSITRAKALLIIVGNPKLLAIDRCWRSVINYCVDKGSFVGSQA